MSKIVFIGGSLVKGTDYGGVTATDTFAYKIGHDCGYADADIINAGVSGDTSEAMLDRLDTDVLAHNPDVCVIVPTHNDRGLNVPLVDVQSNYENMIFRLQDNDIKVVVMSPNVEKSSQADMDEWKTYMDVYEWVVKEYQIPFIDLYREMSFCIQRGDDAPYYVDTVHFTVAGHTWAANYAMKHKEHFTYPRVVFNDNGLFYMKNGERVDIEVASSGDCTINECTYTPTLSAASGSCTYSLQRGSYAEIGNTVMFNVRLVVADKGTLSGALKVSAPVLSKNTANEYHVIMCSLNVAAAGVITQAQGILRENTTNIELYRYNAGNVTAIQASEINNGTVIILTGHYTKG